MSSAFHSVLGVFYPDSYRRSSDVLGAALPPRLDFSIVDTFAYSRVLSEHLSSPRFGSHVFRGGGIPTLLPQARLPRETILLCWGASPPVDAVVRLALLASTSSRINRCHEGTLIHARTLWLERRMQLLSLTLALASDQKLCSGFPSCLWSLSQRISPSLPGSRLTFFCRDANPAILQLVNQWLNFTYSRSHAFRYGRKKTNPTLVRIELTTSALAQQVCRLPTRPLGRRVDVT